MRQYIGNRYVPIFGRKDELSTEWDNTAPYEPLTIVTHGGNSYTSRKAVPAGIDINNEEYWVETGNYNAQIEQYRSEVMQFDDNISQNAADIVTLKSQLAGTAESGLKTSIDTNADNIAANEGRIDTVEEQLAGTASSGLKTSIETNADNIADVREDLNDLSEIVAAKDELIWIGDSWSRNFNALLPNSVAQMLNMTLHTYAVSGTGWFAGSTTFAQQAQQAIADTSVDHSKVRLIVIYGGTNDFYHGFDEGSNYQSTISTTCTALKNAFPNATIHHFFNTCYKHGTTEYPKLNTQIKLWKNVAYYIADSKACVAHAESAYWTINPDAYQTDLLHPVENATKRLAGRVAKSVRGCDVESNRYLDVKQIALASTDNKATGTAYVTAKNEYIEICIYVTVNEDIDTTRGIGTALGMIPFDILGNAAIGDVHNHIAVPMGKNAAMGMAMVDVQLRSTASGNDVIYIGQPNGSGVLTAGSYNGYGKYIMFV